MVCPDAIGYSEGAKSNFMRLDPRKRVDAIRNPRVAVGHARLTASLDFCHNAYYADARKIQLFVRMLRRTQSG